MTSSASSSNKLLVDVLAEVVSYRWITVLLLLSFPMTPFESDGTSIVYDDNIAERIPEVSLSMSPRDSACVRQLGVRFSVLTERKSRALDESFWSNRGSLGYV